MLHALASQQMGARAAVALRLTFVVASSFVWAASLWLMSARVYNFEPGTWLHTLASEGVVVDPSFVEQLPLHRGRPNSSHVNFYEELLLASIWYGSLTTIGHAVVPGNPVEAVVAVGFCLARYLLQCYLLAILWQSFWGSTSLQLSAVSSEPSAEPYRADTDPPPPTRDGSDPDGDDGKGEEPYRGAIDQILDELKLRGVSEKTFLRAAKCCTVARAIELDASARLARLPQELQLALSEERWGEMVERSGLFSGCRHRFVQQVLGSLKLVWLAPGELLFERGEAPSCMYWVVSGRVDIVGEAGRVLRVVKPAEGENAGLNTTWHRIQTLQSLFRGCVGECALVIAGAAPGMRHVHSARASTSENAEQAQVLRLSLGSYRQLCADDASSTAVEDNVLSYLNLSLDEADRGEELRWAPARHALLEEEWAALRHAAKTACQAVARDRDGGLELVGGRTPSAASEGTMTPELQAALLQDDGEELERLLCAEGEQLCRCIDHNGQT